MKREFGGDRYQVTVKRTKSGVIREGTLAADELDDPLYRQIMRISPSAERIIVQRAEELEERYFVAAASAEREGVGGHPITEIAALLECESKSLGVERWAMECTSLQQIFMALVSEANGDEVASGISSRRLRGEAMSEGENGGEAEADSRISALFSPSGDSTEPSSSERSSSPQAATPTEEKAETNSRPLLEKRALLKSQLMGLWYKQIKHYSRDWRFLISTFVIPPVLITATMVLALLRPPSDRPPLLLTPSLYGPHSNSFLW